MIVESGARGRSESPFGRAQRNAASRRRILSKVLGNFRVTAHWPPERCREAAVREFRIGANEYDDLILARSLKVAVLWIGLESYQVTLPLAVSKPISMAAPRAMIRPTTIRSVYPSKRSSRCLFL